MEWLIYAIIFIMGTFFGSFFTLAVYRIPLGIDILYKHSFCPKCNAKLKFIDLIPIVSYISLGGKCRYCGERVRPRYLCLEILSGLVFLLYAISFKINFFNLDLNKLIIFCFMLLYIAFLFIIAGIDKENISINKSVLLFGIVLSCLFMIYVCISSKVIYTYIICLIMVAIFLIIDTKLLKKKLTNNYTISALILSMIMISFTGTDTFYYTVNLSLLLIVINEFIQYVKNRKKRKSVTNTDKNQMKIPVGFYLAVSNICLMIIYNFLQN